ncbi:MAG: amino acid decarboxylase [Clostridia bacterium]|nr:amino acid decarboxylase [Clostridia bacterium]
MDTPICDFVREYREKAALRLHMPGHKGRAFLGVEPMDITEIQGADELYRAEGIIKRSQENASSLFGTKMTCYSAEGSSLCIRAMVYLALLSAKAEGRQPLLLAGRNAHKAFVSACALLDAQVKWLYPEQGNSLIACDLTADGLQKALESLPQPPAAVYVTSPDYLGNTLDIAALSDVCRRFQTLLLADNAHGAYLKFLPEDRHPISLGADLCCDSAHKTLPVLTGGAYLHIGKNAPACMAENARRALSLFASSSPSYLILQSLDQCNAYLERSFPSALKALCEKAASLKAALKNEGYRMIGNEPAKLTLAPKAYGYSGTEMHDRLRAHSMECEFSDPDFLTMMLSPALKEGDLDRIQAVLLSLPRRAPILSSPPPLPHPKPALSIREAVLSPSRETPVEQAVGSVLSDAETSCPPCVPLMMPGEIVDEDAVRCFQYYGVASCRIVT